MSADKKKPSVLDRVLHPSTPALQPLPDHDPQTGQLNPTMNRPAIRPLAGFEQSSIPHPSSHLADPSSSIPHPSSPFSPDPRARFAPTAGLSADPPSLPSLRTVTFAITPTLGAVEHSGSILDRIREHVHSLGLQAKITFHF